MNETFQMMYNQQRIRIAVGFGRRFATDGALGKLLGVSESCATKWRRGEREPVGVMKAAVLEALANFSGKQ